MKRTFTKYPQGYVKANDNQNDSEELGVWLESYDPTSPYLCNQCFTHSDRRYRRCPSCKTLMDLKHKY